MKMTDLQYLAARMALGRADAEEIQETVDQLLADGISSDDFLAIIEAKPPTLWEVLDPFRAYLRKSGIEVPEADTAVWQSLHRHTSAIATGSVRPFEGLERLIADVR